MRSRLGGDAHPPQSLLLRLLRPHWLIASTVALSLALWAIPWGSSVPRGYEDHAALSWKAGFLLALWYATAGLAAFSGFAIGRRRHPVRWLDSFPNDVLYRYVTALAAIGVVYSYVKATSGDASVLVSALRHHTFNQLRYGLEFGTGVHTLRYAAILSGGIAFAELARRRWSILHPLNILLLLLAAAIASRLSLVMATIVAIGWYVSSARRDGKAAAPGPTRFVAPVAILAGLVLTLTALNYIRNANFYRDVYGITNPFAMSGAEAVRYVGAPFQVAVGVARHAVSPNGPALPRGYRGNAGNLVPNGSLERDTGGWETGISAGPLPVLFSSTNRPAVVDDGVRALGARLVNPERLPEDKFVWTSSGAGVNVVPGERYYLRAAVSGEASPRRPIRLGVRLDFARASQIAVAPIGRGIVKRNGRARWVLEGVYTAQPGVTFIQLCVWKEALRARSRSVLYLDGAVLRLIPNPRPPLAHAVGDFALPTYFPGSYVDVERAQQSYRSYLNVDAGLLTNSAFANMYTALGGAAFGVLAVIALLFALLVGHASRYRGTFVLAAFVGAYPFAELWRIWLFNTGLIHVLLLTLVGIPVFHLAVVRPLSPYVRRLRRGRVEPIS